MYLTNEMKHFWQIGEAIFRSDRWHSRYTQRSTTQHKWVTHEFSSNNDFKCVTSNKRDKSVRYRQIREQSSQQCRERGSILNFRRLWVRKSTTSKKSEKNRPSGLFDKRGKVFYSIDNFNHSSKVWTWKKKRKEGKNEKKAEILSAHQLSSLFLMRRRLIWFYVMIHKDYPSDFQLSSRFAKKNI